MLSWEIRLCFVVECQKENKLCFVGPVIEDYDLDHLFYLKYITGDISKLVNDHVYYTNLLPTPEGIKHFETLDGKVHLDEFYSKELGTKIERDDDNELDEGSPYHA